VSKPCGYPGPVRPGLVYCKSRLMLSILNNYLVKKTTLIFPSPKELWDFFKFSDIKEFRLDSAKCSVTGRFVSEDIQLATEKLRAKVEG
jgi:hypothetical protein